ncbi:hypothetical protein BJV82DRAFT_626525 [Fennellomyces sp. T-0311]|nr:hypothetical protein BJV82DRAFT_626525 [Fennellomyces sp. T-0311]
MIISNNSLFNDHAIPLETLHHVTTEPISGSGGGGSDSALSSVAIKAPLEVLAVDKRVGNDDMVSSLVPDADQQVHELMSIGNNGTVQCHGFIYQDTVFMTLPTIAQAKNVNHNEFYSCISQLIEIAEGTDCESLVIAVGKNSRNSNTILRALLYTGFQLVDPCVYNHDPVFILAGYEI